MILAFQLSDLVTIPFGYLLGWLYQLTANYGVALILFSVVVKLVLMPASAKAKLSSMKMSRLTPRVKIIQEKYANDQQKMNMAVQELYKAEGVSMGGSCLWSLLPLLVLFPLYSVVREPIMYLLHESFEATCNIMNAIKAADPNLISAASINYEQMIVAPLLPQYRDVLEGVVTNPNTLLGINFTFLGIDLAAIPSFNFSDWSHIGGMLLPVLSSASQIGTMLISQKMNDSLVTDEKGLQDKETAKNSQTNKSNKSMMFIMPLMTMWIGFAMPAALSLYWLISGVVGTVADVYLTQKYRKGYDAEDAERLRIALEAEQAELEREKARAQRRAANPDGITENTSKKKLQQSRQKEQAAAKAAALKEYAARKGITLEEAEEQQNTAISGIPNRPCCKGRAYDPNRYASNKTEE